MVASKLKIVITQNTIDNLVDFPKSGHIYEYTIFICFYNGV